MLEETIALKQDKDIAESKYDYNLQAKQSEFKKSHEQGYLHYYGPRLTINTEVPFEIKVKYDTLNAAANKLKSELYKMEDNYENAFIQF